MENNKWTVLVADDEYWIGVLIQKLVHWEQYNLICENVVTDGESAFRIIKEKRPDIVITDIRMPKINGLELIRMVKEIYPETRFVVVSGYKEFEYAHSALQYGVENYLLKPINEEELNRVMGKISSQLQGELEFCEHQKNMQTAVDESKRILKREYLNEILEHKEDCDLEKGAVNLSGELYRGIDIKLDYRVSENRNKRQDNMTLGRIEEIVDASLKGLAEEVLICRKPELNLFCLFNYNDSAAKEIRSAIHTILSQIKEYLIGFDHYEVTIGIGMEKREFGDIRFSILEAKEAVDQRILDGAGILIHAEREILQDEPGWVEELTASQKSGIEQALESYSAPALEMAVQQIILSYQGTHGNRMAGVYAYVEQLIRFFFEKLEIPDDEEMIRNMISTIHHCNSLASLRRVLRRGLSESLEAKKSAAENESTRPIREAKKYVDEHYGEKIVLEDLADVVGLNAVYFSVLFKKELGENFSTYLLNVRMEKAKELLRTTNETIAAVGDRVGYKDSRYFSQLFSKHTGIKPALYRKLHA